MTTNAFTFYCSIRLSNSDVVYDALGFINTHPLSNVWTWEGEICFSDGRRLNLLSFGIFNLPFSHFFLYNMSQYVNETQDEGGSANFPRREATNPEAHERRGATRTVFSNPIVTTARPW